MNRQPDENVNPQTPVSNTSAFTTAHRRFAIQRRQEAFNRVVWDDDLRAAILSYYPPPPPSNEANRRQLEAHQHYARGIEREATKEHFRKMAIHLTNKQAEGGRKAVIKKMMKRL